MRSRVQHPELLEDVLIDFPDLTVIVAHMGHPYEELLMNYMRKWSNLYVSCTAYAPRYMDPNLVAFMNTKTYRGRVLWGSDEPWFPMRRSLAEAQALPLDDEAMALFLGGTARRLLGATAGSPAGKCPAANWPQVGRRRGPKPLRCSRPTPRRALERAAAGLVPRPVAGRAHPLVGRHDLDRLHDARRRRRAPPPPRRRPVRSSRPMRSPRIRTDPRSTGDDGRGRGACRRRATTSGAAGSRSSGSSARSRSR